MPKNDPSPIGRQYATLRFGFEMSLTGNKYPFKEAVLSDYKGNLAKKWYVTCYVWSEKKGVLIRKRAYISNGTKAERYQEAQDLIESINEALNEGQVVDAIEIKSVPGELTKKTTIKDASDYFLDRREKIVEENTIRGYKKDIKIFLEWAAKTKVNTQSKLMISEMPIDKFTSQEVFRFSDYIDGKVTNKLDKDGNIISSKIGVAKKTYSNYIATLRTMWSFIIERKVLTENPFLDIKKRRGGSGQHIPYSPAQVRLYKQVCLEKEKNEQLWLFVNFIYYGFFRPREEAQNLQVKHILKRTIIVPGDIAKNNKSEHVRIPAALEALLEKYKIREFPPNYYVFSRDMRPGAERVGINYFYERNRKILDKANLTDQEYDLYGWKHTGVIALYQATKDIKLIQAQCRHKDISTTDKYLRELGLFLDENAMDLFPEAGTDH